MVTRCYLERTIGRSRAYAFRHILKSTAIDTESKHLQLGLYCIVPRYVLGVISRRTRLCLALYEAKAFKETPRPLHCHWLRKTRR
jgi:hypothetical protein